jgi:hypothetical protein
MVHLQRVDDVAALADELFTHLRGEIAALVPSAAIEHVGATSQSTGYTHRGDGITRRLLGRGARPLPKPSRPPRAASVRLLRTGHAATGKRKTGSFAELLATHLPWSRPVVGT